MCTFAAPLVKFCISMRDMRLFFFPNWLRYMNAPVVDPHLKRDVVMFVDTNASWRMFVLIISVMYVAFVIRAI